MNDEQIKAMLCIDHIVWNALRSLLEKHPEENLHDRTSPPWTSRDVYSHLARWLNHSNACIEAYSAGWELPVLEDAPEKMNDRWQKEDSGMSLGEARQKAGSAFQHRLEIIEAIPPDKWDDELVRLVNYDGAMHYARHINYIVLV